MRMLAALWVLSSALLASGTLVSVTAPAIAFFWTSSLNENLSALRPIDANACTPLEITLVPNAQSVVPTAPFYFLAAPIGGVPTIVRTRASLDGTRFSFTPTYRVGTAFMLAMVDSTGLSGGLVGNYVVTPTNTSDYSCIRPPDISQITLRVDSISTPCGEVLVNIAGGVAPFVISMLAPASGLWVNTTISDRTAMLQNIIPAGQLFNVFITDATGSSSIVSTNLESEPFDGTCNSSPPRQGVSLTTLIGSIVGSILVAILIAFILFFYRKKKRAEAELAEHLSKKPELEKDDGQPLVQPFYTGTTGGSQWGTEGIIPRSRPTIITGVALDRTQDRWSGEKSSSSYYSPPRLPNQQAPVQNSQTTIINQQDDPYYAQRTAYTHPRQNSFHSLESPSSSTQPPNSAANQYPQNSSYASLGHDTSPNQNRSAPPPFSATNGREAPPFSAAIGRDERSVMSRERDDRSTVLADPDEFSYREPSANTRTYGRPSYD